MNNFNWLHFSDLHFNFNENIDTHYARKSLVKKLKEENLHCDYIFFTGDIVDKCDYESIDFIHEIIDTITISNNNVRIFWAVGNHDISRHVDSRNELINKIRCKGNELFNQSLSNDCDILITKGMKDYSENYYSVCKEHLSELDGSVHKLIILESVNIIILNTCITSCDENDERGLYVVNHELIDLMDNIDKSKPTIAIGHHGQDFLHRDDKYRLYDLFNNIVDLYLCGHSHRLGYSVFNNTDNDIIELTCGGGIFDNYSKFTFIYGEYNAINYDATITPYSYSEKGNHEWNKDFFLHRKIREGAKFSISRLKNIYSVHKMIITNARFSFSIQVPADWNVDHDVSDNGDGFIVWSSNNKFRITAYGNHDISAFGHTDYFNFMKNIYPITKDFTFINNKNGYVFYGNNNEINFTLFNDDNSASANLHFIYDIDNMDFMYAIAKTLHFKYL